jgi:signal recognition particle receptor subunit beta
LAVVDPQSDAVVIRIIYDGAPMAGKTTSVRALGQGFGVQATSPAEISGRTLYFDWLDYTGGLFEGRRIRCQIIGVPGQATLAPRRRRLIEGADAVVFVGDSTPEGFRADHGYLRGLSGLLAQLSGPPVGVVLQANKRDVPDAVSIEQIRVMLDDANMRVGVVESIATEGSGIREAFVLAVRLALDRVRELMRTGQLLTAKPQVDNANELLEQIKRAEAGSLDFGGESILSHTRLADPMPQSVASQLLSQVVKESEVGEAELRVGGVGTSDNKLIAIQAGQVCVNDADNVTEVDSRETTEHGTTAETDIELQAPATPNDRVASGLVWPPVDGRVVLNELSTSQVQLTRTEKGGWSALVNGRWKLHSSPDFIFQGLEEGRAVLIQVARVQASNAHIRSTDPCVVLAADGLGRYRLWQILRAGTDNEQ